MIQKPLDLDLERRYPLDYSLADVNGGLVGPPFPIVHDQPLCLAHIEGVAYPYHLGAAHQEVQVDVDLF